MITLEGNVFSYRRMSQRPDWGLLCSWVDRLACLPGNISRFLLQIREFPHSSLSTNHTKMMGRVPGKFHIPDSLNRQIRLVLQLRQRFQLGQRGWSLSIPRQSFGRVANSIFVWVDFWLQTLFHRLDKFLRYMWHSCLYNGHYSGVGGENQVVLGTGAVRSEIKAKDDRIVDLQNKLDAARIPVGYKFLKSWVIFSLMWKLYKKE